MAGLNFDITANNSDFLKKTEEIKKGNLTLLFQPGA